MVLKRNIPALPESCCLQADVLPIMGIMALLNRHAAFEGGLGISYGVVLAAYGFIALNGKMQRILVHSFLWVLVAISSSYIMYGAMGIITGSSLNTLLVMDRKAVVFPWLAGMRP